MAQLSEASFKQYESGFFELVVEGAQYAAPLDSHYPFFAKLIRTDLFKFTPTGSSQELSSDCQFRRQLATYLAPSTPILRPIGDFLQRCQGEMETGWNDMVSNAYVTDFIKLDPNHHPYARHVVFHLPNGIKLKGLLALKGDDRPRPLVILRLGIFSNTQEFFPERYLFLQLFEQSPFNMLILESLSGSEFLHNNTQYALGGMDEGLQNFQVAQALTRANEPLGKIIQSLHLFGISLGGHGVLYAALLNELNHQPIAGFVALCPLVNFQQTFEYHQSQAFNIGVMNYWAKNRMSELTRIFPRLELDNFIPSALENIRAQSQQPLTLEKGSLLQLPPSAKTGDFFSRNNFWSDFKNIQRPILIISTEKDPIVPFAMNSMQIMQGQLAQSNVNIQVIPLRQGYHCSLPTAYNWKEFTSILQSYVWKNSGLQPSSQELILPETFAPGGKIQFKVTTEGAFVIGSKSWKFWQIVPTFTLPLDKLYWEGLRPPFLPATQALLRRWMEQNLQLVWRGKRGYLVWDEVRGR